MQIQTVSSKINKDNKPLSFKSRLTFDIGASDPRGSLKVLVQDNKGKDMFEYNGFVNDSVKGFENNDDFIRKIAQAIDVEGLIDNDIKVIKTQLADNSLSDDLKENLNNKLDKLQSNKKMLQNRSSAEKKLTGFALLLPGTLQGKMALFLPNLKRKDESDPTKLVRLTEINLNKVLNEVESQGKVKVAKDVKFIPVKDLAGTGLGVAQKIISHPEYSKRFSRGFFAAIVQTGGGFGAVDVKLMQNSKVNIETNECGHDIYFNILNGKKQRLGKMGASTKDIIRNFSEKMGIIDTDNVKALISTGLGQLATNTQIRLNNLKDSEAIKVLLSTGCYDIVNKDSQSVLLKVNSNSIEKFMNASKYALHSYVNAIAVYAITRINRGANLFVISGPLAMGLNETISQNPKDYEAKNLRELIYKYIDINDDLDETRINLAKYNKFDIVCDKAVSVANNTSGGALLLAEKIKAFSRRGEWMSVPIKILKSVAK